MGRSPCCDKLGLKKGPWTPEEDQKLLAYIEEHGHGNWRALPTKAGLQRCGKSCRLRWTNYLRPDIKRGKFSLQEEQTIIQLHALLGNRWSAIATHLPKRTDNEIKNYWNTHLKKRLAKMGIDPVTHKPKNDALLPAADGSGQQSKNAANLSHIAQWESARLEAEARLARQSKLRGTSSTSISNNNNNNNSSFLSPMSPDIHINDHHQIVPSVSTMGPLSSSTSSSAAAYHQYLSMTATAATTATTTPRCLDVLKAWHNVWPNNNTNTSTNNNNSNSDHFICIGMGSSSGIGGGIGVGIESPTSTLSFSENAPAAVPAMGTGAGAVIEFMGHNNDNHRQHHSHHQDMVKNEDHHHQWKRSGGDGGFDNGIEMNSLSFHDMNTLSIHQSHDHDHDDNNNNDDEDDHNDHGEGFIEGFTELLLSTNNNTSDTTTTKTTTNICGSKSPTKQAEENNNNNNDNSSGSTTRSGGSDYYEDNKTYWNSILNLVNSSPPNSPMF